VHGDWQRAACELDSAAGDQIALVEFDSIALELNLLNQEVGLVVQNLDPLIDLGGGRKGAESQAHDLGEIDLPPASLFQVQQPCMWSSSRRLGQGMLMLTGEEASWCSRRKSTGRRTLVFFCGGK